MTRVCLVGSRDVNLQYELLSRETSREALSTYDLERPFENSLAVQTVSVGAAVSLLNDLQWYIVRFVEEALVCEPSVSETEWLSRELAEAIRNGDCNPHETGEYLKVYGLERPEPAGVSAAGESANPDSNSGSDSNPDLTSSSNSNPNSTSSAQSPPDRGGQQPAGRLVEPLYVYRTDGELPAYDLRPVEETVVVRLTEEEFSS